MTRLPVAISSQKLLERVTVCVPVGRVPLGKVFWVNHADTDNNGDGPGYGTLGNPFDTIAYAATKCAAGRGDLLLVMAGHTEAFASAVAGVIDVDDLTIMGVPQAGKLPTCTLTHADAVFSLAGDNMMLANFRVVPDGTQAIVVELAGTHCRVSRLQIVSASGALTSVLITGDDAQVDHCVIQCTAAVANYGILIDDVARPVIRDNWIGDNFSVGAIYQLAGDNSPEAVIVRNIIYNRTADKKAIGVQLGTSGVLGWNMGHVNDTVIAQVIASVGTAECQNFFVGDDFTKAGALVGTPST